MYAIAIPILARNSTGIMIESMVIARIILLRITAIRTYIGVSFSDSFFVSTTTADIPERKHCLSDIFRISSIASIVLSAEVVSSNMIAIMVASLSSYFFILHTLHNVQ